MIYIENEYDKPINVDYNEIIPQVINQAIDFIKCPYECEVNVTIVDNDAIKTINNEQRGIDNPTDVLSFPLLEYTKPGEFEKFDTGFDCFNPDSGELMLGDIVISYDRVISQANDYNHSTKREIAFLTAHSMLHLFGYDHMEEDERMQMEKMQNTILKNLGITREN